MRMNNDDYEWMMRRLPQWLRHLLHARAGLYVCGGYCRSVIAREEVSDIDVFTSAARLHASRAMIRGAAPEGSRFVETENAMTVLVPDGKPPVQLIHRWSFHDIPGCLASFDFTISAAGFDGEKSYCHERFYEDLAAKRLRYLKPEREEEAGGSLLRVLKFYQRGYRIPIEDFAQVLGRLLNRVRDDVTPECTADGLEGEIRRQLRLVDPQPGDPEIGEPVPERVDV